MSTVSFRFKEVPFFFLKSKIFDLRKILCSKSKNGNQKKSLMQVNLQVENFLKSKIYCNNDGKLEQETRSTKMGADKLQYSKFLI